MKKLLFALLIGLASTLALALPAPKEIEAAVQAGQLQKAETLLHEVIREKPGSAKAHYELGQVLAREGRNGEARQELLNAQRLDPALKFASDPQKFHDLLARIPSATAAPVAQHAQPMVPVAALPTAGGGFPWGYLALAGVFIAGVAFFMRRQAPAPAAPAGYAGGAASPYSTPANGVGAQTYGNPSYGAPPSAGSGIGGAVLGGLAGMAAGYGLAKVLEGGHQGQAAAATGNTLDNGYIPIETPPDYGSFDAGSGGDSWDGGDAGGSDDW